jgi:hypothetical protein
VPTDPVDTDNIGTEIGQQHAGMRQGPYAGDLEYPDSL